MIWTHLSSESCPLLLGVPELLGTLSFRMETSSGATTEHVDGPPLYSGFLLCLLMLLKNTSCWWMWHPIKICYCHPSWRVCDQPHRKLITAIWGCAIVSVGLFLQAPQEPGTLIPLLFGCWSQGSWGWWTTLVKCLILKRVTCSLLNAMK